MVSYISGGNPLQGISIRANADEWYTLALCCGISNYIILRMWSVSTVFEFGPYGLLEI